MRLFGCEILILTILETAFMEQIIELLKEMGATNVQLTGRDCLTWSFNGKEAEIIAAADYDVGGYAAELAGKLK